jgi:hypothetical protein
MEWVKATVTASWPGESGKWLPIPGWKARFYPRFAAPGQDPKAGAALAVLLGSGQVLLITQQRDGAFDQKTLIRIAQGVSVAGTPDCSLADGQ